MITPGPGTYEVRREEDLITIAPKFSTAEKKRDAKTGKFVVPGPGAYEVATFLHDGHRKSPSKSTGKKGKPPAGVGNYKERANRMMPDYPGPGTYNPNKKDAAPSLSIASKTFALWKSAELTPGPGAYSPMYTDRRVEVAMKTSQRSPLNGLMGTFGPGPAAYNTRRSNGSPKYGFGTGQRMVRSSSTESFPGPGQYQLSSARGQSVIFSGKQIVKPLDSNPGPGSYSPKEINTSPAVGIGGGKRAPFLIAKDLPGPGEYDPSHPVHRTVHSTNLNMSARRPLGPVEETPGPGSYDIPTTVDSGPKITLGGRRPDPPPAKIVPGPGAHSPHFVSIDRHSAMAGIGTSQRTSLARNAYGSGPMYDVRKKPDPPAWSFKKEGIKLDESLDDVGPGRYDIPASVPDAPKYLMRGVKK